MALFIQSICCHCKLYYRCVHGLDPLFTACDLDLIFEIFPWRQKYDAIITQTYIYSQSDFPLFVTRGDMKSFRIIDVLELLQSIALLAAEVCVIASYFCRHRNSQISSLSHMQ